MKRICFLKCLCLLLCIFMPVSCLTGCATQTEKIESQVPNTDTPSPTESILDTFAQPAVPKADRQAEEWLQVSVPEANTALTLATLQGLTVDISNQQIVLAIGGAFSYLTKSVKENYKVTVTTTDNQGEAWNTWSLLSHYAKNLSGYILCDAVTEGESASIAVSLAHQFNAVAVTRQNESYAKAAGLSCVLDVTGKDDAWLRNSEYFTKLSREIAVEQPGSMIPCLVDYAVMSNAYFSFSNSTNTNLHDEKFSFLSDGALVFGWNNVLGEYGTVSSFSALNACLVPSDCAYNLSTLSGFRQESLQQKTETVAETPATEAKHTVCFIMSDGDNLQYLLNNYASDTSWFKSRKRGDFAMGWGLPPLTVDLAAPMLHYMYDTMSEKDEFIMQISGLGYTMPSKWTNKEALQQMVETLADYMERSNMQYAQVVDDTGFYASNFDCFTQQEEIKGLFYIDFANYAGYEGQILWSNGKPVVSAKYRLWAGCETVQSLATKLNNGSTDISSPDAYSVVAVHAWSGLDGKGNIVAGGNTMSGVNAVVEQLGEQVEVVTPSEFMRRIIENKVGG